MVAVAPRGRLWRWSTRVCSLPMGQAQPEQVAAWVRGHWKIENRLHWVRNVVFDEDHHQLRTANGPENMAALRNLGLLGVFRTLLVGVSGCLG